MQFCCTAWSPCTNPAQFNSLADGSYEFAVRAVAGELVDPTPAQASWTVDTTPPQTAIDSNPASPTNNPQASIPFSSSESGSTFECNLDAAGWQTCTSSKTLQLARRWLSQHRSPSQRPRRQRRPHARPSKLDGRHGATAYGERKWRRRSIPTGPVSFEFSSGDSSATFLCSLDGASANPCAAPYQLRALTLAHIPWLSGRSTLRAMSILSARLTRGIRLAQSSLFVERYPTIKK